MRLVGFIIKRDDAVFTYYLLIDGLFNDAVTNPEYFMGRRDN